MQSTPVRLVWSKPNRNWLDMGGQQVFDRDAQGNRADKASPETWRIADMKLRGVRVPILVVALVVVVLAGSAAAVAAASRPHPIPPSQYVAPSWASEEQKEALTKSYTQDYLEAVPSPDQLQTRGPTGADYEHLPLLYVAEEDREAVRQMLARGQEPDLVVRPDGLMALQK